MIPLKRVLTYKSKLGFGKWKDYTVRELIDLNKRFDLISAYYKLTSISFTDEILDELGIKENYRIKKPSTDKEMYLKLLEDLGKKRKVRTKEPMKPYRTKPLSKGILQYYNHKN